MVAVPEERRTAELVVKRSRFIATVGPAASADEARQQVARVRAEHPSATHVVYAFVCGPARELFGMSDDGEPHSTAGRPVLEVLKGTGLTDVLATVVRYFGGTKLGVGGLVRAYGGAAGAVLDRGEKRVVVLTERVRVEHPYDCSRAVDAVLAAHKLEPVDRAYEETVRLELEVPQDLLAPPQLDHPDCGPFYFSVILEKTEIRFEFLVRSSHNMHCSCIAWATPAQRQFVLDFVDRMIEEELISV